MRMRASSSDGLDDADEPHEHLRGLPLMALYISAGRRRRRIIISAAVALVLGLTVGFMVGRAMVIWLNCEGWFCSDGFDYSRIGDTIR